MAKAVLFALAPPLFSADGVHREMTRGVVKPATEHLRRANRISLLRERGEDRLRHFLGEMRIAHHAPRRRINDWQMPLDEFAERALRARLHELIQQFAVIHGIFRWQFPHDGETGQDLR